MFGRRKILEWIGLASVGGGTVLSMPGGLAALPAGEPSATPPTFPVDSLYLHHEDGYTNVMARTANGKLFTVMRVQDALVDRCDNDVGPNRQVHRHSGHRTS